MRKPEGVEVGDVRHLVTCRECRRPTKIRCVSGGELLLLAHRFKGRRCVASRTCWFYTMRYSLQEMKRPRKDGSIQLSYVWAAIQ